jgi:hypothetical protein
MTLTSFVVSLILPFPLIVFTSLTMNGEYIKAEEYEAVEVQVLRAQEAKGSENVAWNLIANPKVFCDQLRLAVLHEKPSTPDLLHCQSRQQTLQQMSSCRCCCKWGHCGKVECCCWWVRHWKINRSCSIACWSLFLRPGKSCSLDRQLVLFWKHSK